MTGEEAAESGLVASSLGAVAGVALLLSDTVGPAKGEGPGGVNGRTRPLEAGVPVRGAGAGEPSEPVVEVLGARPGPAEYILILRFFSHLKPITAWRAKV